MRLISHIPVAEALRRIRIGIGLIDESPVFQGLNGVGSGSETNTTLLHNLEAGGSRRHRSCHFSRARRTLPSNEELNAFLAATTESQSEPPNAEMNSSLSDSSSSQ
ncbi:hypothetical protein Hanom_Chr04g00304031 [Helianthus anomalus]